MEVPIPTYYGDEICYVNGMKYARDVVRDVVEYRLASKGFGTQDWVPTPGRVRFKDDDGSSHAVILSMLDDAAAGPDARPRVLRRAVGRTDPRCGAPRHRRRRHGDARRAGPGRRFFSRQPRGRHPGRGRRSTSTSSMAGDMIEHLPRPATMMQDIRAVLRPGGQLLLSVPNFGHWYPRGPGRDSACSATTGAASSTTPICASSPASTLRRTVRDSRIRHRGGVGRPGCRSERSAATRRQVPCERCNGSMLPWSACGRPCSGTSTSFVSYRTVKRRSTRTTWTRTAASPS